MTSYKLCPKTGVSCQSSGCVNGCGYQGVVPQFQGIDPTPIPTGWQCPKCKSIYSPVNLECTRCNASNVLYISNTAPPPNIQTLPTMFVVSDKQHIWPNNSKPNDLEHCPDHLTDVTE